MVQLNKGEIGIKEVIYLIIGILVIILVLVFLGFFGDIKEGLIKFFSSNNVLEKLK